MDGSCAAPPGYLRHGSCGWPNYDGALIFNDGPHLHPQQQMNRRAHQCELELQDPVVSPT